MTYLNSEVETIRKEAYMQGRADALKELRQKHSIIIDEDGIMHKVIYLDTLEKMQKKEWKGKNDKGENA